MKRALLDELMHRASVDGFFRARNVITRSGKRRRSLYASRFGQLAAESPLEWDLITRLDGSWACSEAITQALRFVIPSRFEEAFLYTPDACARDRAEEVWVLECKPEAMLDGLTKRRHEEIRSYLGSLDIKFLVVTESELARGARHKNAILLSDSFRRSLRPAEARELKERVTASSSRSFGALKHALGLHDACTALARGFAYFDTVAALSADTPLFEEFCEAHDAADFLYA